MANAALACRESWARIREKAAQASAPPIATPEVEAAAEETDESAPAEDAVMELEVSDDEVLVFRDAQSNRINVLYRQKDGNYGLIDPEA